MPHNRERVPRLGFHQSGIQMKLFSLLLFVFSLCAHSATVTEAKVGGVTVTSKSLAQALTSHVQQDVIIKGGFFIIEDDKTHELVKLKADKLDDGNHLHQLGKNSFLSWGEFSSAAGDHYLLDFYFEWHDGHWRANGPLSIYSKNKVKRYDWDETGPMLKRVAAPVEAAKK
jgi:hypothetical protein